MKEERDIIRANTIRPAYDLMQQMTFYPTSYATLDDAVANKNLRICVFMHGSGERGTNLDSLYNHPLPELLATSFNREDFIFVCPQLPSSTLWTGSWLDRIIDMLDMEYPNHRDYYVTGLSLGGMAVYNIIERYPTKFSAGGVLSGNMSQIVSAIPNTSRTEIRAWHGTNDSVVTYASGAAAIATLTSQGYLREHTLVDITGGVHDIWGEVYDTLDYFFTWIDEKIAEEERNGISFTQAERVIWQDEYEVGPNKSLSDLFAYSLAGGDNNIIIADKLMNDEVTEFWDSDFITQEPTNAYDYGHYILACGFHYLMTGDPAYGFKAKNKIIAQASSSNPVFEDYHDLSGFGAWGDSFHFAAFTNRMFFAFDYTKDLWTDSEITIYETWMDRAVAYYWDATSHYPYENFPNRDNDDWTVHAGTALSGQEVSASIPYFNTYTHFDSDGNPVNFIREIHKGTSGYGNGQANFMLGYLMWGIYKDDSTIIANSKRWVKECLMMSVWPDGMSSENIRNNASVFGTLSPSHGTMAYGVIVWESIVIMADMLMRKNDDTELYEYSTSYGVWGSEGGSKSIKVVLDCLEENCRSTVLRYYGDTPTYDTLLKSHNPSNFRYTPEMIFAIANRYYKSQSYQDIYEQTANGVIPYAVDDEYFDWVQDLSTAQGMAAALPIATIMYYGKESIYGRGYGVKTLLF